MAGACPTPGADDPLVRGLLTTVDCNVRVLVHSGYSGLFAPGGAVSGLLTSLLVIYVAVAGYQLMLGRAQLRIGDFALTAIKLAAVLALATQWETYQAAVAGFLFDGPEGVANLMLHGVEAQNSPFRGDVFDGLQRALDILSNTAAGFGAHTTGATSTLTGAATVPTPQILTPASLFTAGGLGAALSTAAAALLLLSSLGVLLAAKIVLGALLAAGPIFIALFLFDATRGVFEGWLRAAIAFALAPLSVTLLLGVMLILLEPSLAAMQDMQTRGIYVLPPVYSVMILVLVFVGVALGALIAGAMVAAGFKLPRRATPVVDPAVAAPLTVAGAALQPRAERIAAAASALDRRDAVILARADAQGGYGGGEAERRTTIHQVAGGTARAAPTVTAEARLGQAPRRGATPRNARRGARNAPGTLA